MRMKSREALRRRFCIIKHQFQLKVTRDCRLSNVDGGVEMKRRKRWKLIVVAIGGSEGVGKIGIWNFFN